MNCLTCSWLSCWSWTCRYLGSIPWMYWLSWSVYHNLVYLLIILQVILLLLNPCALSMVAIQSPFKDQRIPLFIRSLKLTSSFANKIPFVMDKILLLQILTLTAQLQCLLIYKHFIYIFIFPQIVKYIATLC